MARRPVTTVAAVAATAMALSAPAQAQSAGRDEPIVLTGADLPALAGSAPTRVAGFAYDSSRARWRQIPVQVDERKFVDFGGIPASDAIGTEGTVYGSTPIGYGALQYADPATWVGPDTDPSLDPDDELALMAGDAGDRAAKAAELPDRVQAAGATELRIGDPLGGPDRYAYLLRSEQGLSPGAGRDYVEYAFSLNSGGYRSSYRRRTGPNPEASRIATADYTAGFSDRWFFDQLAITDGAATGAEILDGFKFSFGPTSCGRSEATFNGATDNYGTTTPGEGAFVANIDGPVRAIRSYVGANSGPLTERTHTFCRDRYTIATDLRVHPVPGPLLYHDLSVAGAGMTYLNSANRAGVPVDGNPDAINPAPVSWSAWTGPQGSLVSADRIESTFKDALMAGASTWYLDDSTPAPNLQCWGDLQAFGQAGMRSTASMPNTDPRSSPTDSLRTTTTDVVAPPGLSAADADRISAEVDAPLTASASPFAIVPDTKAPRTRIAARPPARLERGRARYRFKSSEARSTFRCRLDRRKWRRCKRKAVFVGLGTGAHRLRVRAVDRAGNADRTPARDRFTVGR